MSAPSTELAIPPAIQLTGVAKHYETPNGTVTGVHPTSLTVAPGEIHGIIGFSGAGKSTLLRLVNLLERPDQGRVEVLGQTLTDLSPKALRQARHQVGMIFQHFNLLHNLTVADNVAFPLQVAKEDPQRIQARVTACLDYVGLADKAHVYPAQLSGGQKQRVAIARALAPEPRLLLADEPTSALDPRTTQSILEVLADINRRFNVTILLVTHEMGVVRRLCQRVTVMESGRIIEQLDLSGGRIPADSQLGQWLREFDGAEGSNASDTSAKDFAVTLPTGEPLHV